MGIILIMTLVVWMTSVDPEAQINDRSIPAIAELDIPLVMGSRPKKLNKAIQEAARVPCDRMREGPVGEEDAPLPSTKVNEALLCGRHNLHTPADEDAEEIVANRLKPQLSRHCIRFEDILRTEVRRGATAETRIKRTMPGNETELANRDSPGQRQLNNSTNEVHLVAPWRYSLNLVEAGIVQIPLAAAMNYHSRAKQFDVSLPKDLELATAEAIDEAERTMWTERAQGPEAGIVIHQIMMERSHSWAWHDKPEERQPAEPTQPPPASKLRSQPDFTPKAVGAWKAESRRQGVQSPLPDTPAEPMCKQLLPHGSPCVCHGGTR